MKWTMSTGLGIAAILLIAIAAAPVAADEDPLLPQTLPGIWLKTPGKKLTGDLVLTEDGLEFDSRKRQLFIPFDEMDMLGFGRLPGDVDTEWAILRVVEQGLYRRYAIRDGRRFGYGKRTVEIHTLLRDVMRMQRAGQFRVADGYLAFDLFDTQFTTEYPATWAVTHQELIESDLGMFFGSAVFARDELSPEATDFPAGAVVLHRRRAEKGMDCEGFSKRGLETLAGMLDELGYGAVDPAAAEPAPLGGCAGLKATVAGARPAELRLAADGVTVVVLELRSPAELSAETRVPFDHAVDTFKFAWGY